MSPWRILATYFEALARASRAVDFAARRPGRLTLGSIETMATGYRYTLNLPPLDPAVVDLAGRDLAVTVDGATTSVVGAPADHTIKFDVRAGAHVLVTLTDLDTSGNRSEPSEPLEFDATGPDTVPPPRPGALGIAGVETIDLPDPAPV